MRYTGRFTLFLLIIITSITQMVLAERLVPLAIIFSCVYASLGWYIGYLYDKYHFLTFKDPLTKVYNRRYGDKMIPRMLTNAQRSHTALAILTLDIDNFKCVNDTHGHEYGDMVLKELCHIIIGNVRKKDILIRWGGDEFLVVCPNADRDFLNKIIQQINADMDKFMLESENNIRLSTGIALYPQDGQTIEQLLAVSDENMYDEKLSSKPTPQR
ncbi:GGDEF domain-containing protein [Oceanobacillus halophilus]|uniref:GGDEF domain-containing protein n=1 Tax=Oceanobacillus halophilus TaxID=930130 RepID=A0A494ZSP5_9BACI|nr:GGDEF domain-containing protein [Oceanobacillus halophilus]RKQ27557.1 GGDEF domain-containing protein [Oceanobacillus halophilus]